MEFEIRAIYVTFSPQTSIVEFLMEKAFACNAFQKVFGAFQILK